MYLFFISKLYQIYFVLSNYTSKFILDITNLRRQTLIILFTTLYKQFIQQLFSNKSIQENNQKT